MRAAGARRARGPAAVKVSSVSSTSQLHFTFPVACAHTCVACRLSRGARAFDLFGFTRAQMVENCGLVTGCIYHVDCGDGIAFVRGIHTARSRSNADDCAGTSLG